VPAATKRNGRDRRSRQKYACRACRRTFTENTVSAFSGYRWPGDVILTAVLPDALAGSRQPDPGPTEAPDRC
jgi:transposase-like protein